MVNIAGTNIAASIVPFTTEDTFPTHLSIYGKGGWREVENISERDSISNDRRNIGMVVYVKENDTIYILKNGITNDNWVIFTASANNSTFIFTQGLPNNRWDIQHNLKKYPSVTIVDSAGTEVIGDVQYLNENNITILFSSSFSGKAYLN